MVNKESLPINKYHKISNENEQEHTLIFAHRKISHIPKLQMKCTLVDCTLETQSKYKTYKKSSSAKEIKFYITLVLVLNKS